MPSSPLSEPLALGETLSQAEVEYRFNTNFGYQFKGITYRNSDSGRYVILLANEGAVYEDEVGGGETFTYIGEGVPEKGDQIETSANGALLDAIDESFPIYLFTSTDGEDRYRYRGLVDVTDVAYVSDGERMVYRFQIRRLGAASWAEYTQTATAIERQSSDEPTLNAGRSVTETTQTTRSAAFAQRLKELYDNQCAACGAKRLSPEGTPEVEAAHIYPVGEGGPDDLRNGLTLCRTHHWAFDHGWFAVDNDRRMLVRETEREPPATVARLAGEALVTPSDPAFAPHPTYLEAHRTYQDFEN